MTTTQTLNAYNYIIYSYLGANPSSDHLQEIIDNGIHNITNKFNDENLDFDAISDQFKAVSEALLAARISTK